MTCGRGSRPALGQPRVALVALFLVAAVTLAAGSVAAGDAVPAGDAEAVALQEDVQVQWTTDGAPPSTVGPAEQFTVTVSGSVGDEGEVCLEEDALVFTTVGCKTVSGTFSESWTLEPADLDLEPGEEAQLYATVEESGWWGTDADETTTRTVAVEYYEPAVEWTVRPPARVETGERFSVEAAGQVAGEGEVCLTEDALLGGDVSCSTVSGDFVESWSLQPSDLGLGPGEEASLHVSVEEDGWWGNEADQTSPATVGVVPDTRVAWSDTPPRTVEPDESFSVAVSGEVDGEGQLCLEEDALVFATVACSSVSGSFTESWEIEPSDIDLDPGAEAELTVTVEEEGWWGTSADETTTRTVGVAYSEPSVRWSDAPPAEVDADEAFTIGASGELTGDGEVCLEENALIFDTVHCAPVSGSFEQSLRLTPSDLGLDPGEQAELLVTVQEDGWWGTESAATQPRTVGVAPETWVEWTESPPETVAPTESFTVAAGGQVGDRGEVCLEEDALVFDTVACETVTGSFEQVWTIEASDLDLEPGEEAELSLTVEETGWWGTASDETAARTVGVDYSEPSVAWTTAPPPEVDPGEPFDVAVEGTVTGDGEVCLEEDALIFDTVDCTSVSGSFEQSWTLASSDLDLDPGEQAELSTSVEEDGWWGTASDATADEPVALADVEDSIAWTERPPETVDPDETVSLAVAGTATESAEICLRETSGLLDWSSCVEVEGGEFEHSFQVDATELGLEPGDEIDLEAELDVGLVGNPSTEPVTVGAPPGTWIEWTREGQPPAEVEPGTTFDVAARGEVAGEGEVCLEEDALLLGTVDCLAVEDEFTARWTVETADVEPGTEQDLRLTVEEDGWWGTASDETTAESVVVAEPTPDEVDLVVSRYRTNVSVPVTLEVAEPRGSDLQYEWELAAVPEDSEAELLHRSEPHTSLRPDVPGAYEVAVSVTGDEFADTATATIQAEQWTVDAFDRPVPAVARQYAPRLYFHEEHTYYPTRYEALVENAELVSRDAWRQTITNLTLLDLARSDLEESYAVSPEGDEADYRDHQDRDVYPPSVHVSVHEDVDLNGREYTALGYWNVYVNDPKPGATDISSLTRLAAHTGDQEPVFVFLNESGPQWVAASQHHGGELRSWEHAPTDGDRVEVFVGEGAHSNFFAPYGGVDSEDDAVRRDDLELEHIYQYQYLLDGSWTGPDDTTYHTPGGYVDIVGNAETWAPGDSDGDTDVSYDLVGLTERQVWTDFPGSMYTFTDGDWIEQAAAAASKGTVPPQQDRWAEPGTWATEEIQPGHAQFDGDLGRIAVDERDGTSVLSTTVENAGPQPGTFVVSVTATNEAGRQIEHEREVVLDTGEVVLDYRSQPIEPRTDPEARVTIDPSRQPLDVPLHPDGQPLPDGQWEATVELATLAEDVREPEHVLDERTVSFTVDRDVSANLTLAEVDAESVSEGDSVAATAVLENTGPVAHTYFVGYSVEGPDGETFDEDGTTGTTVTVEPGERREVPLEWTVETDAPQGTYDVVAAAWFESDREELHTRLANAERSGAFELDRTRTGTVEVTSTPDGAMVYADGEVHGETPVVPELPAGTRDVVVAHPDHEPVERTVTVEDGETVELDVDLSPAKRDLVVESDPTGAEVYVDDERVGTTPHTESLSATQTHDVRIEREGYDPVAVSDVAVPGTLDVELEERTGATFDLEVDDEESQLQPAVGEDAVVVVTVENTGDEGGQTDLTLAVEAEASGEIVHEDERGSVSVPDGGTETVTFEAIPASEFDAGEYRLVASAADAEATGSLTVTSGTSADLADYRLSDLEPPNAPVEDGAEPVAVPVTVKNVGGEPGEQSVALSVSNDTGTVHEDRASVSLESGATRTVSFEDVPLGALRPGEYALAVTSRNDTVTGKVTVRATRDAAVRSLQHDDAVAPDGEFTVTVVTETSGETALAVEPEGVDAELSSDDAAAIEDGRAEFVDPTGQSSTYEVHVDVSGGADGDVVDLAAWVDGENRSDATDVASGTVTVDSTNVTPADLDVELASVEADTVERPVNVTATVTNDGSAPANGEVDLGVDDRGAVDTTSVSLDGGEATNVTLQWTPAADDDGEHDLVVATAPDTATQTVTVDEVSDDGDDGGDSGSGLPPGGSGPGGDDDGDNGADDDSDDKGDDVDEGDDGSQDGDDGEDRADDGSGGVDDGADQAPDDGADEAPDDRDDGPGDRDDGPGDRDDGPGDRDDGSSDDGTPGFGVLAAFTAMAAVLLGARWAADDR